MDEATLASIHAALMEHTRLIDEVKAECREKCECGVLEARCDSLERSVRVLKKDVRWTYLAPDIPRSHWIEQGHSVGYADVMKDYLRRIKGDAEAIRNGSEGYCCECLDNGSLTRPTILHDDALLPHFKELADAIQVSDGIPRIIIDNVELRPSALGILFPAMEGKVTIIYIESIIFSEDVAECYETIATSIRRNYSLEGLLLGGTAIPSYEQADLLIKSIKDNRSIKQVQMENRFNQNGRRQWL